MAQILFLKEWRESPSGRVRKPGELADIPDDIANRLIAEGIAEKREAPGPQEFKDKAQQGIKEIDPEDPDDPDEDVSRR